MTLGHLLPLLVAVPLLGALGPVVLGVRRPELARRVALSVLLAQVALAVVVAVDVATNGPRTYIVGGLPASYGIGLLADELSSLFVLLVAASAAGVYIAARTDATGPSDGLWLLLVAGLTGVVVTADVFNLYVFLEISGLAAYALVASRRGSTAALAALHYLLVGTVGATFYLLGVGYLYVATGTLAMADLRVALASVGYDSPLVVAAFVLVTVGLGVKLALFPLHAWKPDAYAAAPLDVSALLATLGSTVAGYALVRVTFGVFTASFFATVPLAQSGLLAMGVVSVVAGGYLTLRQSDVQRLLAYSSVLQFGFFVVGVALATPLAVTGALVLLIGHAIAKGGLFVAAGLLEREYDAQTVADYAGRARDAPVVSLAVAAIFASLVGLPPTSGFAGKWYVALAAIETREWTVVVIVLLSTLLSLLYAGRVVERLYLGTSEMTNVVAADGGQRAENRAVAFVVLSAVTVVALGFGSTAMASWLAPVVEGWL